MAITDPEPPTKIAGTINDTRREVRPAGWFQLIWQRTAFKEDMIQQRH